MLPGDRSDEHKKKQPEEEKAKGQQAAIYLIAISLAVADRAVTIAPADELLLVGLRRRLQQSLIN